MRAGFRRNAVTLERSAPVALLLTPLEAGLQLSIPESAVKRLARRGLIPGAKRIGSSGWRFTPEGLKAFARSDAAFVSTQSAVMTV